VGYGYQTNLDPISEKRAGSIIPLYGIMCPPHTQVVQQEALTRLFVEKGIFIKEESWEIIKMVDLEMKRIEKRYIYKHRL
jgi:hypothetical protein